MKRTLSLALAAMLVVPALASANPTSDKFKIIDMPGGSDRTGQATFQSRGSIEIDIWCIDEEHFAENGNEYNVWVTRLSGSDFSKTHNHGTPDQYRMAAYMSSFMGEGLTSVNLAPSGWVGGDVSAHAMQSAIWRMMGFNGTHGIGGADKDTGLDIYNHFTGISNPFTNDDLKFWYVVTAKNPGCDGKQGCLYQEFLVNDPDRPQETVPEPATMTLLATGLAGMAAARKRRKS